MIPGVGYALPHGERTYDGWPIDGSVVLVEPGHPDAKVRLQQAFGPLYFKGDGYMHTSDHAWFLQRAHELSLAGKISGLLINDGKGYDGHPTLTEISWSHRGVMSPVAAAVSRLFPGDYGYGVEPLDTSGSPEELERMRWSTATWRTALDEGIYKNEPDDWKAKIRTQLGLIEAGEAAGWVRTPAGTWVPDKGQKVSVKVETALASTAQHKHHLADEIARFARLMAQL